MTDALRNIVYRFDGSPAFARALRDGDQELPVPKGETVTDGEWVLAIFEIGEKRRATASPARGLLAGAGRLAVLGFERRDWERLVEFAEAGSLRMAVAAKVPSDPVVPIASAAVRRPPERSTLSARALVVQDQRDLRDVVAATLEAAGLVVDAVGSAEDALDRIRGGECDLVVLDWNLPGMNGVELCRTIRREPSHETLPVLFLSSRSATQDVVDAFAAGADVYVVNPFRPPELGARIFALLRRARRVPANQV